MCGWHEVGSLRLASSPGRFEELQRQAGWAQTFGLPLELITADEARARFPLMSTDGVLGAVWLPTDGWLDPSGLAFALAAGARREGCPDRARTPASIAIDVRDGRVRGVEVEQRGERRRIEAEVVVLAGGMYTPELGRARRHPRADRADGPRIPVHRARSTACTPTCRSCATRTTSSTSARRSAACAWAATSATRRPGASTASRPTSTTACSTPTGRGSRRSWPARSGASPRWPTRRSAG